MINIAGGGVRGLSCALYLLKKNHPVTVYESRQEIGNPVRSPGISKTIPEDLIKKTSAVITADVFLIKSSGIVLDIPGERTGFPIS